MKRKESEILHCSEGINPHKRGRYQVFRADKSVPTPKVSLWRMKQETDNIAEDFDKRSVVSETADPVAIIDAFHEKSFSQVSSRYNYVS